MYVRSSSSSTGTGGGGGGGGSSSSSSSTLIKTDKPLLQTSEIEMSIRRLKR